MSVCRGLLLTLVVSFVPAISTADELTIRNQQLSVTVRKQGGAYEIRAKAAENPVIRSLVAAQINHRWIKSNEYPQHRVVRSSFQDVLGHGEQLTVALSGLPGRPNLQYILRLYDQLPFGYVKVQVQNQTRRTMTIEAIRSLEAFGEPMIDLGARESFVRVLSDGFTENDVQIHKLGQDPQGLYRAVGSQLIYNRDSKQSVFFGGMTASRFLTIMHLQAQTSQGEPRISSYTIDSTGTTEIHAPIKWFRQLPKEDQIELSLPLAPGTSMDSEDLMFASGTDYHAQLEAYGAAIRQLHHARVSSRNLMGWWSWTAHYDTINEGKLNTNARWLAQHLKASGYDFFHIDDGYQYSRGEYTTPNAAQFPHGMQPLTRDISQLGLNVGLWVALLEVDQRAAICEKHKDWFVHNAKGKPIRLNVEREIGPFFVLDPINQEHRSTSARLIERWLRIGEYVISNSISWTIRP